MSETIATLERVREACQQLSDRGETLTAMNVLRLTGGSKSTVLRHLQIIRVEIAASVDEQSDPAIEFLREFSDPFVKRIWTEAKAIAEVEYKRQIKILLDVQAGLLEDIRLLQGSETELQQRAQPLNAAGPSDTQVDRLLDLLEQRLAKEPTTTEPAEDIAQDLAHDVGTPAVVKLLDRLARSDQPVTKRDLDKWIGTIPDYQGTASGLRTNALDYGFAGLSLTEKGRQRLQRRRKEVRVQNENAREPKSP